MPDIVFDIWIDAQGGDGGDYMKGQGSLGAAVEIRGNTRRAVVLELICGTAPGCKRDNS